MVKSMSLLKWEYDYKNLHKEEKDLRRMNWF